VATIGKEGLSPTFAHAVDRALEDHELIKVRVGKNALVDRHEAAETLAEQTASEVAQVLGNTILLYRRHPEEPKIELP
jgi:RNA-binding protein